MNKKLLKNTLILITLLQLAFCAPCHAEFYRYNIDELARKAKARIREIEQRIVEEQMGKDLEKILADITALYNEAESLFAEKRYEEAVTVYRKIDRMSRNGEVQRVLKQTEK